MTRSSRTWRADSESYARFEPETRPAFGPQGDALILELRKLQRALDQDATARSERDTLDRRRNGRRRKTPPPRIPQEADRSPAWKEAASRALTVWLEKLGWGRGAVIDRYEVSPRSAPRQEPRDPGSPTERKNRTGEDGKAWSEPLPGSRRAKLGRAVGVCHATMRGALALLVDGSSGATTSEEGFSGRIGRGLDGELRVAFRVLVLGVGIVGVWATFVPLSGAVVLPGTLVVESNVKKLQHPTGGVVAEIAARDGMHVDAGDLVLRLDETQIRANRQVLANQLDQIRVRLARLVAERDGMTELKVPRELSARMRDATIEPLVASERSLLDARAQSRRAQKDLLRSTIGQLEDQIAGLQAQLQSKSSQLELISSELIGVNEMYSKGLAPLTRLTTLKREAARLEGEQGQLTSAVAETKAKIGQGQLQIMKVDQDLQTEVMKDLREAEDKEAELVEKIVAAQDQLNRVEIRAPTSGVVHQLSVHTIGGVIRPSDVVMEIVPESDALAIEARLTPHDIDQVRRGQTAYLRFSAFNQRTTPQLAGVVSYVSADLSRDAQTNSTYYTVRITLSGEERRRLGDLTLIAGMPVDAFLQTGSRTMMSYLLKPLLDQFQRMFIER